VGSGRREWNGGRECRICQTHAGVRGFPAKIGSGSFWVGADGLVIVVSFGVSRFFIILMVI
jgi:hypothetical protein